MFAESLELCTSRFGGGEPTFAGASCNDQDAPRAAIGRDANDQQSATPRGQSLG